MSVWTGAAVLNVVEYAGEHLPAEVRLMLVGAIAVALLFIALLMRTIQIPAEYQEIYRRGGIITMVSSLIILLLGLTPLDTIPLLIIVIVFMLLSVYYGLKVWVEIVSEEAHA